MSSDCDDCDGGISPAANHLYYWIRDPTNDGQVYCHDVVPYTVREVLVVLSEVEGIFDFEGGASASSHLSVRPGIQPEVATYRLLLEVIGAKVGGDDIVERGVLRDVITRRTSFLATVAATVNMSAEEVESSWREICVLPEMDGGSYCESTVSEDESDSDSGTHSKRQKRGFSTSAAKKMAELKKDYVELKKDNKELMKNHKMLKKNCDKLDARNLKQVRDMVDFKLTKVREINDLKEKQKEEITKLKNNQKTAINDAKRVMEEEKVVALTVQRNSK